MYIGEVKIAETTRRGGGHFERGCFETSTGKRLSPTGLRTIARDVSEHSRYGKGRRQAFLHLNG